MSRKSKRNRYRNYEQLSQTATGNTSGNPVPYTGGTSSDGLDSSMLGIKVPSYMNDANPYNSGVLPQDIPVNDPRFRVSSVRPFEPEVVTRKTVWDYYRVAIALPNPSKVLGTLQQNIDAFDELLADARVKACFNNRRAGLLSLKWSIDQNNSPARLFKLVQKCFDKLDIYSWLSQASLSSFYGYDVSEVNWKVDGGAIIPESIIGKAARWFVYDDSNSLRYKTKVQQVLGEALPPRKFIVTRHHHSYDNPYGEPLAEACYWPVKFRHIIFQYAMQFLERYGMPWLDVTMESGLQEERIREILDVIQNTYQDGIVSHPDNTKITPMMMSDAKTVDSYTTMLDNVNREIDMAILGNNLNAEVKGGSYAAAQTAAGVRADLVDEDKRMIEGAMNQLIEWIAFYNAPAGAELPKFRMWKVEPATKEKSEVDIMLAKMGVKFTKEYFSRVYQLNSEDFELGEPVQELNPGMKGDVVEADMSPTDSKSVGSKTDKQIEDATIENKDQSSNVKTKKAIMQSGQGGK